MEMVVVDDDELPLSEDEKRVLALYDRLAKLQEDIAVLKAQRAWQPSGMNPFFSGTM
jgi:uncharacterized small protein (DUF1192 family)